VIWVQNVRDNDFWQPDILVHNSIEHVTIFRTDRLEKTLPTVLLLRVHIRYQGDVFTEPLPSNELLLWFCYTGFEFSCNSMKFIIPNSNIVSFARRTNIIHCNCCIDDTLDVDAVCVKSLGLMLESKLYFYQYVDCMYSHAFKLLGLISFII
jgi:hypothetical protein